VETDRSGLVAEYVGQTAVKVNRVVDSALNGVLFIDEAYALVGENHDDFGKEAVATLIRRMENDRDRLVVILAGYSGEMQNFIETNPGFRSRFNRYFEFDDFTPEQLVSMYMKQCEKLDYIPEKQALNRLNEVVRRTYNLRDRSFGNGRFIRNLFEKTIERQANRIAGHANPTRELLCKIIGDDIPA
jgi:AAA+ superfamily predicted ATPase